MKLQVTLPRLIVAGVRVTQGDPSSKRNGVIGVTATLELPVAFTRRERRSEGTKVDNLKQLNWHFRTEWEESPVCQLSVFPYLTLTLTMEEGFSSAPKCLRPQVKN